MLREQLRLRNEHVQQQRQELSDEKIGPVFLLGSTLAESSPVQQRGPLRVMQAWAPAREDDEDRVTATLSEEVDVQEKINWRALEANPENPSRGSLTWGIPPWEPFFFSFKDFKEKVLNLNLNVHFVGMGSPMVFGLWSPDVTRPGLP